MWQVEVSHKSEMAGPFKRGDTIINKHFTLLFCWKSHALAHFKFRIRFKVVRPRKIQNVQHV